MNIPAPFITFIFMSLVSTGTTTATVGLAVADATDSIGASRQEQSIKSQNLRLVATIDLTASGQIRDIEIFSHYVARQVGFDDPSECPQLCKLANNYLRKSIGWEENVLEYVLAAGGDNSVYLKLVEEFNRCILAYLAYHWGFAGTTISQALCTANSMKKRKLRKFVMTATRKQRFERVTKNLRTTRVFCTLLKEMQAINISQVPAAHFDRSPVLLFMGGGMGAGKSTVLEDIYKSSFWSGAYSNAVVVEADAFKETDIIYKALSSSGSYTDMLHIAEHVHKYSTDAASSLLVTALNEGLDVIMDGTLSWYPFVEQTIAMARNVHNHRYRMGTGYKVAEDGTVTEKYWEVVEEEMGQASRLTKLKPYRVELVGVICDPYLAVVRGIRRAIITRRAVRVKSQLTSHKRFANAFPAYSELVDKATLYSTNVVGCPPNIIAIKEGDINLLVDPEEYKWLSTIANLNENADSIEELYLNQNLESDTSSIWNTMVLSPGRTALQQELKTCIQKLEKAET